MRGRRFIDVCGGPRYREHLIDEQSLKEPTMDPGLIGGIVGGLGGLAGGVIGTYFSIKNTKGPRSRAFMVRASIVAWIAVSVFLTLLLLLPNPYRHLLWIPYGILLPLGIIRVNRRMMTFANEGDAWS